MWLTVLSLAPRLIRFAPVILALVAIVGGAIFKKASSPAPHVFKGGKDVTAPTQMRFIRSSDDPDASLLVRFHVPKEEAPDVVDVPLLVRDGRVFLGGESPKLKDGSPLVSLEGSHAWYWVDPQFDRLDLGVLGGYSRNRHNDDDDETFPFEPGVRVGLARFAGGALAVDAAATTQGIGLGLSVGAPHRAPYPLSLVRVGCYRLLGYDDGELDTVVALSIGTR